MPTTARRRFPWRRTARGATPTVTRGLPANAVEQVCRRAHGSRGDGALTLVPATGVNRGGGRQTRPRERSGARASHHNHRADAGPVDVE